MKLVANWGAHSPRLDRLIAAECSHCDGLVGRLVRHDACAGGTRVWLACRGLARDYNIAGLAKVLDPMSRSR